MMATHRKEYKVLTRSNLAVSATSNKSRILLLMMMVIALVFFISSFLAASFSNSPTTTTTAVSGTPEQGPGSNCILVRTAEGHFFADCMFN
jgi:hypothetical protein